MPPRSAIMGRSPIGAEVFNFANAPDTGNMEVLARCTPAQKGERWLTLPSRGASAPPSYD